jgi:hypothetical protein
MLEPVTKRREAHCSIYRVCMFVAALFCAAARSLLISCQSGAIIFPLRMILYILWNTNGHPVEQCTF